MSNLSFWLDEIDKNVGSEATIIIVGNKIDLGNDRRKISFQEGKEFADSKGLAFFECSAKDSTKVSDCFSHLVNSIYSVSNKSDHTTNHNVVEVKTIPMSDGKKKKTCLLL